MPAFITFRLQGRRFIGIPKGSGVHVIDENGLNYGAWMHLDNFKENYREVSARGGCENQLGRVKLSFQCLD